MKTVRALMLAVLVCVAVPTAHGELVVQGRTMHVIDLHLHPGHYANLATGGKAFIIGNVPPFARLYAPALLARLLDPYAEHIGIREQTGMAGVDQAILYAVYAPRTTGYLSNRGLLSFLTDPRNRNADGAPWALGFVSINFEDFDQADNASTRIAALESYLQMYPELCVGIKLAHAHQAVRLDDESTRAVYDVAARHDVPVLLHTGFSPFPGSQTDPVYYDPEQLAGIVRDFDGLEGRPRVDFVLSHVGQGDARSVLHSLDLAQNHDNVWLEISALGRPESIGADGKPTSDVEPQYPWVLDEILQRGLVEKTLFGSDGPQFSGQVRTYTNLLVEGLLDVGYSLDQIEAVLSGNALRLFPQFSSFPSSR